MPVFLWNQELQCVYDLAYIY
ncbi:Uncharacterized Protein cmbei_7004665 [Cryptosporidium meleagridis]